MREKELKEYNKRENAFMDRLETGLWLFIALGLLAKEAKVSFNFLVCFAFVQN